MLKFKYRLRPRRMPKASGVTEHYEGKGPEGRIQKLRELVTALVRHERIEGNRNYLDESRPYVELLIQRAHKHGDRHKETMQLADYWLLEKDLIHKLFKVLAPRYNSFPGAFTQIHLLPYKYPGEVRPMACLELKGNPWPPVKPHHRDLNGTLINVLIDSYRRDHEKKIGVVSQRSAPVSQIPVKETHIDSPSPKTTVPKDGTPV